MLSDKLKEQTKVNHQLLEKKMLLVLKTIKTHKRYAKLLCIFYSYYGGIENLLDKYLNIEQLPDFLQRRKSAYITMDLFNLKTTAPLLLEDKLLPVIENHYQALGALYVMEGSTLGGKTIGSIISRQLDATAPSIMSFFTGYGPDTANMWQEFIRCVNKPLSLPQEEMVIEAANETFLRFGERLELM